MRQLKINKSITPRSEQSLDKYLSEISRAPLVSTEEEVLLAQAIHAEERKVKLPKTSLLKPICALWYLLLNNIRTKVFPLQT